MPQGITLSSALVSKIENIQKNNKDSINTLDYTKNIQSVYEKIHKRQKSSTIDNFTEIPYNFLINKASLELPKVVKVKEKKQTAYLAPLLVKPEYPHFFDSSLEQVLNAIKSNEKIEGINLLEALKNSSFKFATHDHTNLSALVSDVLVMAIKYGKEINPEIQELGRQKVKNNADDFAKEMYPLIQNLKTEHGINTFRETIDLLNMKNINTARGGKWHLRNYELLTKRWKKLGYNP